MKQGECIKSVVYSSKRNSFLTFMGGFGINSNSWSPEPITALAFNEFESLESQINKSILEENPMLVKVHILWEIEVL